MRKIPEKVKELIASYEPKRLMMLGFYCKVCRKRRSFYGVKEATGNAKLPALDFCFCSMCGDIPDKESHLPPEYRTPKDK